MSVSCRQLSWPMYQVYRIQCPVQNGKKLYLDSKTSDVHFVIHSEEKPTRIPAHRILLANNSDVFKALFYDEPRTELTDIPITDVSEAAFKEFLQFFYLSDVELHVENIADLMLLGHKYKVTKCIDVCVQFLKDTATPDNILAVMSLAILYNHADILKFCEKFVIMNTDAVLESKGFLECDHQTLAYIVNANLLTCSEVNLFEACMAWVKAKSKQNILTKAIVDEYLGDLFYEIRFGTMSIHDLCVLATKYDSVLSDDFKTITKLIVMPNYQPERFNTRPRQIKWIEDTCIMGCNTIDNECDDECDECECDDDDEDNFKRKNDGAILFANKRLRLINSAANKMHHETFSSDEDTEYAASNENQLLLTSIDPQHEQVQEHEHQEKQRE